MDRQRNETLQALCRGYLRSLRHLAKKHNLGEWLQRIVNENRRGECEATEHEVEMLSRMVDDERIARTEIPQMLNKSYRQCFEDEDFDKVKKLHRVGVYSKVSALLYASKLKGKRKKDRNGTKK